MEHWIAEVMRCVGNGRFDRMAERAARHVSDVAERGKLARSCVLRQRTVLNPLMLTTQLVAHADKQAERRVVQDKTAQKTVLQGVQVQCPTLQVLFVPLAGARATEDAARSLPRRKDWAHY